MLHEKIADLLADDILNQSMEKEAIAPLIGAGIGAVKAALPKMVSGAKNLGPNMASGVKKIGDLGKAQKNLMGARSAAKAAQAKGVMGDYTGALNARNEAFQAAKPSLINVGLIGSGAALGSAVTKKETEAAVNEFELEKEAGAGKAVKKYFEDLTGKTRADVLRTSQNATMGSTADFISKSRDLPDKEEAFINHVMENRKSLANDNKLLAKQEKSKIGTAAGLGIGAGAVGAQVYQDKQSKIAGYEVYLSMMEKEAGFGAAAKEVAGNLTGKEIRSTSGKIKRWGETIEKMKNTSNRDLGMKPLEKAVEVQGAENVVKNLKKSRMKAVGKTVGAWGGVSTGAIIGHQLAEKEATEALVEAVIKKQAAMETMAESNIIAEASERALNSLGYSCLQNLEKGL